MKNEFMLAFNEVLEEKGLPKNVVLEALEAAMVSAYRRAVNASTAQLVEAKIDPETGAVTVFAEKEVVDSVQDERTEVALENALKIDPSAELGGMVVVESTPNNFGRVAAQTARQVIQQRIREAERDSQMKYYAKQVGDIVSGVVQAVTPQQVTLGLDMKAEGVLPRNQQINGEHFRVHDRVQSLLLEVKQTPRGPQIVLSRSHRNFLRCLLENEVPEIYHGLVEIRSIAREPGQRSKVAVAALQPAVDPVGACVGIRGVRIQAIVRELNDEKIDVIEFDPDPAAYIAKALSPARVTGVYLNEHAKGTKTATVVVMDDQLSLAIGRDGQNARLAAKLTGWRIDIKSLIEAAGDAVHRLQSDHEFASMAELESENIPRVELILGKKAEGRPITPEEYQFLSQFVDRVERGLIHRRTVEKLAEEERRKETRAKIPVAAFAMSLEDLALTERINGLLSSSGYETIGDLMFQLALDEDAVLGISGIGPKAMGEIKEKLANIAFPTAEPEVVSPEVVEQVMPEVEKVAELTEPVSEEMITQEQPEEVEEVSLVQLTPVEEGAPTIEEISSEPELIGEEPVLAAESEGKEEEAEKPIDFNEIFALRPEILGVQETEEEEEEEDLDKKGKKKKKKKKFVEVVYDPDRDITLVKRKRKRGGDWEDDWNF
ncbi:MAG: transcription termination factor NusA [Anaerolineales bacterium]|jgi:N utilization substance protein A